MPNVTTGTMRVALFALVVTLVASGAWLVPAVIAAVMLMVVAHEFGHFITARLTGMKVTEFFVGFGPKIWSTSKGETEFGLKALPFGGYVKIIGMSSLDTVVDAADEPRSYRAKSYPRRLLVAVAGSTMHLVLAFILSFVAFVAVGEPKPSTVQVAALSQWDGVRTPAQRAGLAPGDQVLAVNGRAVTGIASFIHLVHNSSGQQLHLALLRRSGQHDVLVMTPVDGRGVEVAGARLAPLSGPAVGYFGVELANAVVPASPWRGVTGASRAVWTSLASAVTSLPHMFSPHQFLSLVHDVTNAHAATSSAQSGNRPVSGVGAVRLAVQSAHAGLGPFLSLLVTLNVFVGVINLLPMLPLDGGLVAVATYERLRSRRGKPRYQADLTKLAPFVVVFVGILAFLFLSTAYLDITHPVVNPFK